MITVPIGGRPAWLTRIDAGVSRLIGAIQQSRWQILTILAGKRMLGALPGEENRRVLVPHHHVGRTYWAGWGRAHYAVCQRDQIQRTIRAEGNKSLTELAGVELWNSVPQGNTNPSSWVPTSAPAWRASVGSS